MKPVDELREKFLSYPYHAYMVEHRPVQGGLLWAAFLAGANAAMDMQFEPGAVRFGDRPPIIIGPATPEEIAALQQANDGVVIQMGYAEEGVCDPTKIYRDLGGES